MSIEELLPKNKFDHSNLQVIRKLPDEELAGIIYELYGWIEDYNWPIAEEVRQILVERQNLVFPYISEVLNGDNYMWKYWTLELLIPYLRREYQEALRGDIERIAVQAVADEDAEALAEQAQDCLARCFS